MLTDEIDAAKSEAKAPEDYSRREDYYPLEYWAQKMELATDAGDRAGCDVIGRGSADC